jgi:hypothetical protein
MSKIRELLVDVALAVLSLGAAPLTAQAADTSPTAATTQAAPTSAQADGLLYLWKDTNYQNSCAAYAGNSSDWGNCDNVVSYLWNNGYPGSLDDVWLYYLPNYQGARRGVYNGVRIPDLAPYPFDAGTGSGAGQSINNNVMSHKWTNLP